MRRFLIYLIAISIAHACLGATLTGRVKRRWSEDELVHDVAVTVRAMDGTKLATTNTYGTGTYKIEGLPKKRVEISYQRDGWNDHPEVYPPIVLTDGETRHEGQLSPDDADSQQAKAYSIAILEAERSSLGSESQLAALSRLSPESRARVADAYASEVLRGSSESEAKHHEVAAQLLQRMDQAYERRRTERAELHWEGVTADLSELGAVRLTRDNKIILTLYDSYFEPGQSDVPTDLKKQYANVARYFKPLGVRDVVVEGHADSTGASDVNDELAQRRADEVRRLLLSAGVSGARVRAIGKGEAEPGSMTAISSHYDRRVDLVLTIDKGGSKE
jgi:outer membrane protein OmpA-like peptidoglycan-associated protein